MKFLGFLFSDDYPLPSTTMFTVKQFLDWMEIKQKTKHRNRFRDAIVKLQINYTQSFHPWKLTSAAFLALMFPATDIFTKATERNKTGKVVNCLSLLHVLGIFLSFSQSKTQVFLDLFPCI